MLFQISQKYIITRHLNRKEVINVFDRIVKAAEGAALGTGTTMNYEMIGGTHELLINETLQKIVQNNLEKIGGYIYDSEEKIFAEKIAKSLDITLDTKFVKGIKAYTNDDDAGGSTMLRC